METVNDVNLNIFSFLDDPRVVYLSKKDESLFSISLEIVNCALSGNRASALLQVNDFKKTARERFDIDLNLPLENIGLG